MRQLSRMIPLWIQTLGQAEKKGQVPGMKERVNGHAIRDWESRPRVCGGGEGVGGQSHGVRVLLLELCRWALLGRRESGGAAKPDSWEGPELGGRSSVLVWTLTGPRVSELEGQGGWAGGLPGSPGRSFCHLGCLRGERGLLGISFPLWNYRNAIFQSTVEKAPLKGTSSEPN